MLLLQVSKKWHALLSSPLICSTSCRNFVSHRVLDTNAPDWEADYLRYAKRRLNVITGRPVSKARYICEYTIENTENKFHYSDGMLAWCLDVTTIRLLSLQTGHSERARSFAFNKRQPIVCVRVSSSIVAVLTSHG